MTDPRIPDEVVAKAVIAKGSRAADEGVGHTMRRALEAVIDDLLAHNHRSTEMPHTNIIYEYKRERLFAWAWNVQGNNSIARGRTWTRHGARRNIRWHIKTMRLAAGITPADGPQKNLNGCRS